MSALATEGSFLTGVGGRRIFRRTWLPEAPPRAVIALAHGFGEHSGRYEHVAAKLVDAGYAVYAVDHRGHGRSEGPRAVIDGFEKIVSDLDQMVVVAAGEHPGKQVFLLGHSMGGAIALRYTLEHQDRLAGLLLSGPLAAMDGAPAPAVMVAKLISLVAPKLPIAKLDANLVSRDPEIVRRYNEDPLVYHGGVPAKTVAEMAGQVNSWPASVGAITIPTLLMYGTADGLCPPRGAEMLKQKLGASDLTVIPYEGLYHEILNEPEQERVMDDMLKWLDGHAAP
jgi:lysophospholipase